MTDRPAPPRRPREVPDEFVAVGQIVGAFGLKGALRVRLETDFPERLVPGREFIVASRRMRLREARIMGANATITLEEVTDRTAAEALRGEFLLVPKAELPPLPEGEFYIHQLVGLRVQDRQGRVFGTVTDVLFTGANDVYVVATPHGLLYLPAIEDVVLAIDLEAGVLIAEPLEGSIPTPPKPRLGRQPKRRRRSSPQTPARGESAAGRPSKAAATPALEQEAPR
ncbi:MAG: ribosome maturation factor RimM [Chloroflexota bacterium]|nr:ribosome maturation factor RimM [Dehalococcoidia bacterium]MDW8253089.1 ribosome maturation factor RimM [Chloroflexota bacterium]